MKESQEVVYNGQIINKKHFRVYVYGVEGQKKLVNNYTEYEMALATGLWFDSMEAIPAKPKPNRSKKIEKEFSVKAAQKSGTFEVTNEAVEDEVQ